MGSHLIPPFSEAALLGAVQGLTSCLPVSSDGHLALAEILFKMRASAQPLNLALQAGTLLATVLVFWPVVERATVDGLRGFAKPSLFQTSSGARDAAAVIVASVPTVLLGFGLGDAVAPWSSSPLAVGIGFAGTSAWVLSAHFAPAGRREQPTLFGALLIGVAQGLSVLPGLSRTAATIASALWLGVRAERAFELSFLMSLPALLGAMIVEGRHAFAGPGAASPLIAAALVALVTAVGALLFLQSVIARGRFVWFALWTVPVAIATLALALVWPH